MIRRPPRSTQSRSSAASDVYKRQIIDLGATEPIRPLSRYEVLRTHAACAPPRCRTRRPLPAGGRPRLGGPRGRLWEKGLRNRLAHDVRPRGGRGADPGLLPESLAESRPLRAHRGLASRLDRRTLQEPVHRSLSPEEARERLLVPLG